MRSAARFCAAVAAALSLLAASGCASIPRSGPVGNIDVEGRRAAAEQNSPEGPVPGAGADQVVRGFLAAGAGPGSNFAVGRKFLTDDLAAKWEPTHNVYVLRSGRSLDSLSSEVKSNSQSASVNIPVESIVDSKRMFTGQPSGGTRHLDFRLRQVNGEWRIAKAPNAIVVPAGTFYSMFQPRSLFYYTADFRYVVPDERWYLRGSQAAFDIVKALLNGPADYLRDAVVLPGGKNRPSVQQVSVDDGTANVRLSDELNELGGKDRDRLAQMIVRSLSGLGTVRRVEIQGGSFDQTYDDDDVPDDSIPVTGNPVAIRNDHLVELDGDKAKAGLGKLADRASDPAVDYRHSTYAYLSEGRRRLHRLDGPGRGARSDEVLLRGKGLVGPSFDRTGWIFTAEAKHPRIRAVRADGDHVSLPAPFLSGRQIVSIRVSRDGSRLAVVSSEHKKTRLDVIGLVRDRQMVPKRLVTQHQLDIGRTFSSVKDISWMGSRSLAVLGSTDANDTVLPYSVTLSGVAEGLGAVTEGTSITAGSGERDLRIVTSSGSMYRPNPPNSWDVAEGLKVKDPAYPG